MAVEHFPGGIKIGPDASGNDRLPLYDFDEYATNGSINFGSFTANQVKNIVISNVPNLRPGSTVIAKLMNPNASGANFKHLLILHVWASAANEVTMMVRNLNPSSITFGSDQVNLSFWCTLTP